MGGGERRRVTVCLAVAMIFGIAVYFKLWTVEYSASSRDNEILRRQFDLANREATDESAEWRLRYDEQLERTNKCESELQQVKESFQKGKEAVDINQKLATLHKERMALIEHVEALKQELENEKLRCNSQ